MSVLAQKTCEACDGDVPALSAEQCHQFLADLGGDWKVVEDHHLINQYIFDDFKQALAFTNQVGELAESQWHHPDILLSWGKVQITIFTHKVDGLTESDFILAAKIDQLPGAAFPKA